MNEYDLNSIYSPFSWKFNFSLMFHEYQSTNCHTHGNILCVFAPKKEYHYKCHDYDLKNAMAANLFPDSLLALKNALQIFLSSKKQKLSRCITEKKQKMCSHSHAYIDSQSEFWCRIRCI